jgi:hypothetical protein
MSAYWGKADIVLRLWQNFSLKETIARQASLASKRAEIPPGFTLTFACGRVDGALPGDVQHSSGGGGG